MKTDQIRVLFICLSNAFRSRVAEAVLHHRYGVAFTAAMQMAVEK